MKKPPYWLWPILLCWLTWPAAAEIKTLKQWITQFKQSGMGLFYSSEYLTAEKLNQPIELADFNAAAFNQALQPLALFLQAVEQHDSETVAYLIRPMQQTPQATALIQARDAENQRVVRHFNLTLPAGQTHHSEAAAIVLSYAQATSLEATIQAAGYYPTTIRESLINGQTNNIKIDLEPLPLALSDIRVSTSLVNYNTDPYNQHSFSRQDLNRQININQDPLRSAEQLAGNTSNGISGRSHTRGGNVNESMILLDGRELRNPYHFKDFLALFSTINDSVVESIDHYSGVFPVQYGGRLSAVMDVQTKSWSPAPNHQLNMGLLSAGYTWQQQNAAADRSWLLAVRTGGQLINDHLIEDLNIRPEFDDAYLKATQQLNPHWQVSEHLLVSRDELAIDQEDELARASQHDQNIWINWAYDDWQQHQSTVQLYGSRRHDRRVGALSDDNTQAEVREDIISHYQGIKWSHQWQYSDAMLFHYGLDVAVEDTRIQSFRSTRHHSLLTDALNLSGFAERDFHFDQHGVSASSFVNLRYRFNEHWLADVGVHYQHREWLKGGDLSPRINLAWFISERSSWRLGIGRHQQNQHIDELLLEDQTPDYFAPASADLAVLEFNHRMHNDWQLKAELYHKKYSSTHPYYENLFNGLHVLPDLFYDRIRIDPDDARAMGMEWTLSGQHGRLNWTASYAYADVTDELAGQDIRRSWNQRNSFKLLLGWSLGQWDLNLNTSFHNGWPMTRIITTANGYEIDTRNQTNFRDFYQLDARIGRSWQNHWGQWRLALQLSNALNTSNPCCRDYRLDASGLSFTEKDGLPLVPDLRFSLSWD